MTHNYLIFQKIRAQNGSWFHASDIYPDAYPVIQALTKLGILVKRVSLENRKRIEYQVDSSVLDNFVRCMT